MKPVKRFEPIRIYRIAEIRTGKVKNIKSPRMAFDTTVKYYPDIVRGEYYSPNTIRFYSPSKGYILTSWED